MNGFFKNSLLRGLTALVVGVLLIVFSSQVTQWIVMLCGLLFIIPGAVAVVSYFRQPKEQKQTVFYPIVSVGCILFGLVLVFWPSIFVEIFEYILAASLAVASIFQAYTLWTMRSEGRVHPLLFLVPLVELAVAMYIFLIPKAELIALPAVFVGAGFILYSLLDMLLKVAVKKVADQVDGEVGK